MNLAQLSAITEHALNQGTGLVSRSDRGDVPACNCGPCVGAVMLVQACEMGVAVPDVNRAEANDGGLEMKVHPTSSRVVLITGVVYALIGLVLVVGGAWLLALGGSAFYVVVGLGVLVTGGLLVAGQRSALWVYAAVLIGTLIWAVSEVQFDWWPLAARGDVLYPLGLWLLTPWVTRHLDAGGSQPQRSTTLPLWAAVVVGAVVLVIGLVSDYHETNGTVATASEVRSRRTRDTAD